VRKGQGERREGGCSEDKVEPSISQSAAASLTLISHGERGESERESAFTHWRMLQMLPGSLGNAKPKCRWNPVA